MQFLLSVFSAVLFACGVYCMLRRNTVRLLIGLALLGHSVNIAIFTIGGLGRNIPILAKGTKVLPPDTADPVPQALLLTAIVIGLGLISFAVLLVDRLYAVTNTEDTDTMKEAM